MQSWASVNSINNQFIPFLVPLLSQEADSRPHLYLLRIFFPRIFRSLPHLPVLPALPVLPFLLEFIFNRKQTNELRIVQELSAKLKESAAKINLLEKSKLEADRILVFTQLEKEKLAVSISAAKRIMKNCSARFFV